MKRCKYLNENQVQWVPGCLIAEGYCITNPSEETLERFGYSELVDSPRNPERSGMVQRAHYQLSGNKVLRTWYYEKEESL